MKEIKVGTISGIELLMHRKGKFNRTQDDVKRGVGVYTPLKHKKKTKQKLKNEIRGVY